MSNPAAEPSTWRKIEAGVFALIAIGAIASLIWGLSPYVWAVPLLALGVFELIRGIRKSPPRRSKE